MKTEEKTSEIKACLASVVKTNQMLTRYLADETANAETMSEDDKLRAAYALNMCTVSVSQIVDYQDLNVLEQEYEAILNNLNLEQIPKDEALLHILRQILDTVTFFRIEEGDKAMIEKEYQQKMKNAIWSAVPNFGMIVAGGNPVTMAISLASQIGIGYMNYRRTKAENSLEREKQMWQLERSAIEQFNGLRRELFDTSWRLADTYHFPEKYRLTERQIKQYNAILMDSDIIRKYERLEAIQEKFEAYPPFWYHFGNTANAIARGEIQGVDKKELVEQYKGKARQHFLKFREVNKFNLLREDPITSACDLELVDLLLEKDKNDPAIRALIDEAKNKAGNSWDILQLCVIAYLKINAFDEAARILKILVNEEYNTVVNAQFLSNIYVYYYLNTKDNLEKTSIKTDYMILSTKVDPHYLFPFPVKGTIKKDEAMNQFLSSQKTILTEKYRLVLGRFLTKYTKRINSIIPLPKETGHYLHTQYDDDSIYLGLDQYKNERISRVKTAMSSHSGKQMYKRQVSDVSYTYELLSILNDFVDAISQFDCFDEDQIEQIVDKINKALKDNKSTIQEIEESLGDFSVDEYTKAQCINLKTLVANAYNSNIVPRMNELITPHIEKEKEENELMSFFANAESQLADFCRYEDLPLPEILFEERDIVLDDSSGTTYFAPDVFGESAVQNSETHKRYIQMCDIVRESVRNGLIGGKSVEILTKDDDKILTYFKQKALKDSNQFKKTLAVIDDHSMKNFDLLLTTDGVVVVTGGKVKYSIAYQNVKAITKEKGKEKEIEIDLNGRKTYYNSHIDMEKLRELIGNLSQCAGSIPQQDGINRLEE